MLKQNTLLQKRHQRPVELNFKSKANLKPKYNCKGENSEHGMLLAYNLVSF